MSRNNSKFVEGIIGGISILIVMTIIILIAGMGVDKHKNGYIQGDYSEYNCSICDNAADGGAYFLYFEGEPYHSSYYCKEHFSKQNSKKPSSDNVECKVCNRKFKKDSKNAKSIKKTNMCTQCYKNYKAASDYLNELPTD